MEFLTSPRQLLLFFFLILPFLSNARIDYNPRRYVNMNVIDRCWRHDVNWYNHRQNLAMCSAGFTGRMKKNTGKHVTNYMVVDSSDHPTKPKQGTLRYGATMVPGKVWITFKSNMVINLKMPLLISNYTVVDGRGANVHIAHGSGFLLYQVSNVIIHGLHFHDIKKALQRWTVAKGGEKRDIGRPEGADAIRLVTAAKIWIDHNTFYRAQDGLIDTQQGSTRITISNNRFKKHDKVMLLGANDNDVVDRKMKITILYNHFGPECRQRMPRIRFGYVHIANNLYEAWHDYAIGGSMHPTILSEGNIFKAATFPPIIWKKKDEGWHVKSNGDMLLNGAKFMVMNQSDTAPRYGKLQGFSVTDAQNVHWLTLDAGALHCRGGTLC